MRAIISVHVAFVHDGMDTEVLGKGSHAVISGDMASIGRIEATFFFAQLEAQNKEPGD